MTGMEDVLESVTSDWAIPLSPDDVHTIAEALNLAGVGNLHDAWNAGYTIGNVHNGRRDANPYPKVSET